MLEEKCVEELNIDKVIIQTKSIFHCNGPICIFLKCHESNSLTFFVRQFAETAQTQKEKVICVSSSMPNLSKEIQTHKKLKYWM